MPRLKKLSHLKQNSEDEEEKQESSFRSSGKGEESREEAKAAAPGRKMKYRQRMSILKEFENRSKHKEQQNVQLAKPNTQQQAKKVDMTTFLDKFTDDDQECSDDSQRAPTQLKKAKRAKKEKKEKREIKVANKFFTDCPFEEMDIVEKQVELEELLVQKRQSKNPGHLLLKVEKKAQNYKNRLDFKNFGEDIRFKQGMREKLKSIEGCDEVNLVIEVPKVFNGKNSHADAALFIKNVKQQNESSLTREPSQQELDEFSVPRDRKNYYEGLAKKMKMKKAETITESILKECFKKSRLDENDYLLELDDNPCEDSRRSQKLEEYKRTSERLRETESQSMNKAEEQNRQEDKEKDEEKELQKKQQEATQQESFITSNEENLKENNSKSRKETQNQEKQKEIASQSLPVVVKEKIPKKKNAKKLRMMRIKDLIEEQAEDSDDGQPRKKGQNQSESQSQDGDLSSLIDDDITLCEEEEAFAHRKFVKDMVELQEMKFIEMQKKYLDQRMQEQERLRQRMEAAARRNRKNETVDEELKNSEQQVKKVPSQASDSSISNAKNLEKIKQLEIDLGLLKPNSSQTNPHSLPSQNDTVDKALSNLEKLLSLQQSSAYLKPSRKGLLNLDRIKAKKKGTKQ